MSKRCPRCFGTGGIPVMYGVVPCPKCGGLGNIEGEDIDE